MTSTTRRGLPCPDIDRECTLWKVGFQHIGGVDEAGRGAWAGPVFAAAVVFSPGLSTHPLLGHVRDSKQMTAAQRAYWAPVIKTISSAWGIGSATNKEIDRFGIIAATHLAVERALEQLKPKPDYLLLDYLLIASVSIPQEALVKGDQKVLSIAAASVLAKTARDAYMITMHGRYPSYLFNANKGYGTKAHQQALNDSGISPVHRQSFQPVKQLKKNRQKLAVNSRDHS